MAFYHLLLVCVVHLFGHKKASDYAKTLAFYAVWAKGVFYAEHLVEFAEAQEYYRAKSFSTSCCLETRRIPNSSSLN